jgi:hypothetical protein
MAAAFRAEDVSEQRDGRTSWDNVDVKARNARLVSTVVGVNVAGMRRQGGHR